MCLADVCSLGGFLAAGQLLLQRAAELAGGVALPAAAHLVARAHSNDLASGFLKKNLVS